MDQLEIDAWVKETGDRGRTSVPTVKAAKVEGVKGKAGELDWLEENLARPLKSIEETPTGWKVVSTSKAGEKQVKYFKTREALDKWIEKQSRVPL